MSRRSKYNAEEKLKIVEACLSGKIGVSGMYAAAVPNGRVRRSLTRRGASIPMRR